MMVESFTLLILGTVCLIWLYLYFARGRFWYVRDDLKPTVDAGPGQHWPSVAVIVPARNEAEFIPRTLPTLLNQNYEGLFHIYVVDDNSEDYTYEKSQMTARQFNQVNRITLIKGSLPPAGWTGKLWALEQGVKACKTNNFDYLLFTDADIKYSNETLALLVDTMQQKRLDLISYMVKLRAQSLWEKILIPAFVYFFRLIYPFNWVCNPSNTTAAAAGGCVLINRLSLENSGGLFPIRNCIIDDCALAKQIKRKATRRGGRIRLGLTFRIVSLREYESIREIWQMISRTAFEQLNRSYLFLIGTVLSLFVIFIVPPTGALAGLILTFLLNGHEIGLMVALLSIFSWSLMTLSYYPIIKGYQLSPMFALLLPFVATIYTIITVDSAVRYKITGGFFWKNRILR